MNDRLVIRLEILGFDQALQGMLQVLFHILGLVCSIIIATVYVKVV